MNRWMNDFEDICVNYYNWYSCIKNYEIKGVIEPPIKIIVKFDIHQDTYLAEKLAGKDPIPEFDQLKNFIPKFYPGDPQMLIEINWI